MHKKKINIINSLIFSRSHVCDASTTNLEALLGLCQSSEPSTQRPETKRELNLWEPKQSSSTNGKAANMVVFSNCHINLFTCMNDIFCTIHEQHARKEAKSICKLV